MSSLSILWIFVYAGLAAGFVSVQHPATSGVGRRFVVVGLLFHDAGTKIRCEPQQHGGQRLMIAVHATNPDDSQDECDYDEESEPIAYGNRSVAWTNRYRKLLPYQYARATAMDLGLRRKEEWDEYLADGKEYHGPYLPTRPDEMYQEEWVSWEEFLGIMRDYDDTKNIVQNILQLQSMEEYSQFVKADTKRARGLRIPAMPDIVYRDKGWLSCDSFFGTTTGFKDDDSSI